MRVVGRPVQTEHSRDAALNVLDEWMRESVKKAKVKRHLSVVSAFSAALADCGRPAPDAVRPVVLMRTRSLWRGNRRLFGTPSGSLCNSARRRRFGGGEVGLPPCRLQLVDSVGQGDCGELIVTTLSGGMVERTKPMNVIKR